MVCAAPASVVIEIDSSAERWLDVNAARRLIALELSDVDVAPARNTVAPAGAALYFRVLGVERDLRVELWERGELLGTRSLRPGEGNKLLVSRSLALTAAELARRASQERIREAHRLEQQRRDQLRVDRERQERERRLGWAVRAGATGEVVGDGDLWQVGPLLEAVHTTEQGLRLSWGVRLAAGSAGGEPVESFGVVASPGYRFDWDAGWGLEVGISTSAMMIRFSSALAVDGASRRTETWSAFAGPFARLEGPLLERAHFSVGPTAGLMLRGIDFVDGAGTRDRVTGAWVGLSAAAMLSL